MEEVKSFFAARGIGTSELAKGLVIHEVCFTKNPVGFKNILTISMLQVLGAAILFSAWGGCYFARPSARYLYQINLSLHLCRNLGCRLMAALKTKKNIQWVKAQERINVSPLVSRISRCESRVRTYYDFSFLLKGWCPKERLEQWVWLLGRVSS